MEGCWVTAGSAPVWCASSDAPSGPIQTAVLHVLVDRRFVLYWLCSRAFCHLQAFDCVVLSDIRFFAPCCHVGVALRLVGPAMWSNMSAGGGALLTLTSYSC